MTVYYCDWSQRNGVTVVTGPTKNATTSRTLLELVASLLPDDVIVLESTFEAFAIDRREQFLRAAWAKGINVLTTPPRMTSKGRRRNAAAYGVPGLAVKTDENDARAIAYLSQHGQHVRLPLIDGGKHAESEQAREALMHLRREGTLVPGPRGGLKFTSGKDIYACKLLAQLPPYASLTPVQRVALGDGKDYSLVTLAAVGVATEASGGSREVFDQLAGLYSHAYPNQIRADLMHWSWAGGNKRAKLEQHYKDTGRGIRADGLTLTDFRREVRWLFHQLKVLDTSV